MANPKMKGVTSISRKGTEYSYARIDGQRKYCGKDDKGYQIAVAAKAKEIAKQYENKEINAGLRVKKVQFKNFTELCNWYMGQPSIQEQAGYKRKLSGVGHLFKYFGHKQINQVEGTDQEKYRAHRKQEGAKEGDS